ncbi:helix-turn-helix transcriptional regulator [Candidatus Chlorohelix sp.]|uniref:helix-turn-helix transcriptional regulator n=1 Tax=Candidatus Chlorohelix sp. TaxID=3139201 RepID=UPI0030209FB2
MVAQRSLNILEGLAPIVGLRIRESRTDKGMSQKELVGERFSKSYISSIERGKITPSLKALEYIAKQLGVTVSYLLTGMMTNQLAVTIAPMDDEQESPARWDLLITEAKILREQRRYEQARNLLTTKVRIRQLSVEQLKNYHFTLATVLVDLDNSSLALPELGVARELAEKTADFEMQAKVRQLTGIVYMLQSKPVLAIEQLRTALQSVENGQIKDIQFQLSIYSNLGILHYQLGDMKEAISMYREALRLAENASSPDKLANLYAGLSAVHRENGNLPAARNFANKALALYECASNQRVLAQLRAGFGVLMRETEQFDEAETQFEDALRIASFQRNEEAITHAHMNLSDLFLQKGELEKARSHSDAMLSTIDSVDIIAKGQAFASRAGLLSSQQDLDSAIRFFEQAVELLEHANARDLLSKIYFRYAGTLRQKGDTAHAAEMYERAYRQLNRAGIAAEL